MKYSIQNPDLLNITDPKGNKTYFGPNQAWFTDRWRAQAGCGPASASLVTAYLAFTCPKFRALYSPKTMNRDDFLHHMNEVYDFVTPGITGLNKISRYADGVTAFAAARGISLTPRVFEVRGIRIGQREPSLMPSNFIADGLNSDCPIGFMALSRGRENRLQNWHWVTIASAEIADKDIRIQASDEGGQIVFDLQLWYTTTRLPGGLVYFTE